MSILYASTLFLLLRRDFVPLVNDLGTYFQIRDDYMNLKSDVVRSS